MAVVGQVVTYGVPSDMALGLNQRNFLAERGVGGHLPVAGDQLPAVVVKDYGGSPQTVDLHILLNGGATWWAGQVPNGTAGTQGKWW